MKIYISILLLMLFISTYSQNYAQYESIPLSTANDYRKAEPQVMLASDLILSTPIEKNNLNRQNAISFIAKWMQGTSDYSFVLDETIMKVTNNDKDLIGVYFACITKYALEKGKHVDREELKINTYKLLAYYCENAANNYKVKGEIKKLVDAKNQNKLKEYLDAKHK